MQHVELEAWLSDNPEAQQVFLDHIRVRRQIRSWARGERFCRAGLERLMADLDGLPARNDERGTTNDDLPANAPPVSAPLIDHSSFIIHHSSFFAHPFQHLGSVVFFMRLRHCFWASGCSVRRPGQAGRTARGAEARSTGDEVQPPEIIEQRHVCARTPSAILRVRPRGIRCHRRCGGQLPMGRSGWRPSGRGGGKIQPGLRAAGDRV